MDRPPKEREEEDYFQEIEAQFARLRGASLLLSTRDVALVDAWWKAGIPLRLVVSAVGSVFEKRAEAHPSQPRSVHSLAYCRHAVEEAFEDWRESRLGGDREAGGEPEGALDDALQFLRERARELEVRAAALPPEVQGPLLEAASQVVNLAAGQEGPAPMTPAELEERLESVEDRLLEALLAAMSEREREDLNAATRRDLEPLRVRLTERAYQASLRSDLRARLRDRHHLPRLTLYLL